MFTESEESNARARFYWASNQGYLASKSQEYASALGSGIAEAKRRRSLEAAVGDPANPDPGSAAAGGLFIPMTARGDFVFQTAGRDGVYLSNDGEPRLEYRYSPGGTNIRVGLGDGLDRFWRTADGLDDIIVGGN